MRSRDAQVARERGDGAGVAGREKRDILSVAEHRFPFCQWQKDTHDENRFTLKTKNI